MLSPAEGSNNVNNTLFACVGERVVTASPSSSPSNPFWSARLGIASSSCVTPAGSVRRAAGTLRSLAGGVMGMAVVDAQLSPPSWPPPSYLLRLLFPWVVKAYIWGVEVGDCGSGGDRWWLWW